MQAREPELVWLRDDRLYAVLVNRGAYFSTVKYTRGGIEYEREIENDDYEFIEDYDDYESE